VEYFINETKVKIAEEEKLEVEKSRGRKIKKGPGRKNQNRKKIIPSGFYS